MTAVVEIRSYTLRPGKAVEFGEVMRQHSMPLLRKAGMDVVAFKQSMQCADVFMLIRAYSDLAQLTESQDQFYASDEWRAGPREAVLACIENFTSVVIEADDDLLAALRRL